MSKSCILHDYEDQTDANEQHLTKANILNQKQWIKNVFKV